MEINLRNKKKWLLSCSYNPKKTFLSNHIAELSKSLDLFTTKYERLLFLGDFNAGMEDSSIKIFCSNFNLISMTNKPTCYKNPDKPTCIDLILINCPGSDNDPSIKGKRIRMMSQKYFSDGVLNGLDYMITH